MSDIVFVRFIVPVTIGSIEHNHWSAKSAETSSMHGKIGIVDRGDRGLLVTFDAGADIAHDIEVPRGNVAQITHKRAAVPQPQGKK